MITTITIINRIIIRIMRRRFQRCPFHLDSAAEVFAGVDSTAAAFTAVAFTDTAENASLTFLKRDF